MELIPNSSFASPSQWDRLVDENTVRPPAEVIVPVKAEGDVAPQLADNKIFSATVTTVIAAVLVLLGFAYSVYTGEIAPFGDVQTALVTNNDGAIEAPALLSSETLKATAERAGIFAEKMVGKLQGNSVVGFVIFGVLIALLKLRPAQVAQLYIGKAVVSSAHLISVFGFLAKVGLVPLGLLVKFGDEVVHRTTKKTDKFVNKNGFGSKAICKLNDCRPLQKAEEKLEKKNVLTT